MEEYFEHLINAAYRIYQEKLIKENGDVYPLRSTIIKFDGFRLSYNWYGRTLLGREKVGDLEIYTKEIHLNILFAYYLTGIKTDIPDFEKHFGLKKLINTIAHELAHCLLANFNLFFGYDHEEEHKKLTKDVEMFLWTLPEVKELEKIQGFRNLKN